MKNGYPPSLKRDDVAVCGPHTSEIVLLDFATECSVGLTMFDWFAQTSEVAMMDADSPFEDISAPDEGYRRSERWPLDSYIPLYTFPTEHRM